MYFLDLPREIRDLILDKAILLGRNCPLSPLDADYSIEHRELLHDIRYLAHTGGGGILHMRKTHSTTLPLLLTNRQVHVETKDAIRRLPNAKMVYLLDIMFVDDQTLWPTWLCVPKLKRDIEHLRVQIRIFGGGDAKSWNIWRQESSMYEERPFRLMWTFYATLERLCRRGPVGYCSKIIDEEIIIRKLELNVLTSVEDESLLPPHYTRFSDWLESRRPRMPWQEESDHELLRKRLKPEWLYTMLYKNLARLLIADEMTAEYQPIVCERIERIDLKLDHELQHSFLLCD